MNSWGLALASPALKSSRRSPNLSAPYRLKPTTAPGNLPRLRASWGRSRSNQWNNQFFPRPVANEMRGRPQVIGVVMAVDAVQHFNAHAQKSCRFPFVDPARINQVAAVCRLCSRLHSRHYLASMGRWLRIGRGGGAYGVGILAYITGTVDQQLLLRNEY